MNSTKHKPGLIVDVNCNDNKIDKNRLIAIISNLGQKDIDIGLFQAVDNVFNTYNLDCNDFFDLINFSQSLLEPTPDLAKNF